MSARLVCAGSLTLDNVVTADRRLLPQSWGGNVIYSALGARLWHERVGLVSRAGWDFPADCLAMLRERGLDTDGIRQVDAPHGMNVAFCYAADGSRVRAFPAEVMAAIPPTERARFIDYTTGGTEQRFAIWTDCAPDGSDLPDAWLADLAGMHAAAMPVARHLSLAERVRRERPVAWIQVDSPWYDERALERDFASPLFRLIDALLPSEDDVVKVVAGQPLDAAAADLVKAGARVVVLKRGSRGCEIMTPRARVPVPAFADARLVDLTGAGDAFCGGFLAGIHQTGDLREAALRGTVSASFAIEDVGLSGLLAATPAAAADRLARLRSSLPPPAADSNQRIDPCL